MRRRRSSDLRPSSSSRWLLGAVFLLTLACETTGSSEHEAQQPSSRAASGKEHEAERLARRAAPLSGASPARPSLDTSARAEPSPDPRADAHGPRLRRVARLEARPGRKLDGTVELTQAADGRRLVVNVQDTSADTRRVRAFAADSCVEFGVGPNASIQTSAAIITDRLNELGSIDLDEGHGSLTVAVTDDERAETVDGRLADLGRALVLFAPVKAHDRRVEEPIACALLTTDRP